eukprot:1981531-Pyramimonas_sp.AAC.1
MLDQHPPWTQFKATFRRAASTDIEAGPNMAQIVTELVEAGFSTVGIQSMTKAMSSSRSGGRRAVARRSRHDQ